MRRCIAAAVLLVGLFFANPAYCWDFAGHFVVAAIAREQLDPAVRAEADRLLQILARAEPATADFVPAAAWLDAQGWNPDFDLMNDWHYLGLSYPPRSLEPRGRLAQVTVTAVKTLAGKSSDFQKALMLRVLLHTIGDMHQPLHAIERSSPEHSGGDGGGRAFGLQGPYPNLHALWDAAGGQYPYLQLQDWQKALPLARGLEAEYPAARFGVRPPNPHAFLADFTANPTRWIEESYLIALTTAYNGIEPQQAPSADYLEKVRAASRRQLAQAGYRLGHLLNACLDQSR